MVQPPKHQPWVEEGWALRGPDGLPGLLDNQYNRKDYGEGVPAFLLYCCDMNVGTHHRV
jgi:hypothetical protein